MHFLVSILAVVFFSIMTSGCVATSALTAAIYKGDKTEVEQLLHQGVDINEQSGPKDETPLMAASRLGKIDIVRELLKSGADIDFSNKNNDTALMVAARQCKSDIVQYLIDDGADVNVQNKDYLFTPLMFAVQCNDPTSMKALIIAGANVNTKNRLGVTALILAASGIPPKLPKCC